MQQLFPLPLAAPNDELPPQQRDAGLHHKPKDDQVSQRVLLQPVLGGAPVASVLGREVPLSFAAVGLLRRRLRDRRLVAALSADRLSRFALAGVAGSAGVGDGVPHLATDSDEDPIRRTLATGLAGRRGTMTDHTQPTQVSPAEQPMARLPACMSPRRQIASSLCIQQLRLNMVNWLFAHVARNPRASTCARDALSTEEGSPT